MVNSSSQLEGLPESNHATDNRHVSSYLEELRMENSWKLSATWNGMDWCGCVFKGGIDTTTIAILNGDKVGKEDMSSS